MNITENPINFRVASESEKAEAVSIVESGSRGIIPEIVLVSETAFPGQMSYYRGVVNEDGVVESGGWIGKL